MHALGNFIQQQMDQRGWKQADLFKASGLSRSHVSRLLGGGQTLGAMIKPATVAGLSKAFSVDETVIITKAAEAMGIPVDRLAPVVMTATDVPNDVLLEILRVRLDVSQKRHPSNGYVVPNTTYGTDANSDAAQTARGSEPTIVGLDD